MVSSRKQFIFTMMTQHASKDQLYHDDIAATYDETVVQPRVVTNDIIYAKIARRIKRGDKLLDLGCGTGHLTGRLGHRFKRVIAVDHSAGMLAFARKNLALHKGLRVEFVHHDAKQYVEDCAPDHFDTIGCVGFLHHLQQSDIAQLISQIYRTLKPGGVVILQEPIEIPPNSVPPVIARWNSTSVVTRMQYCHSASPPDEKPLLLEQLSTMMESTGFQMKLAIRSWEIFPHALPASLRERYYIRYLNWRHGRSGNVYTALATKPSHP